jgi:WhiB family redox-sensing transcriptional regulator
MKTEAVFSGALVGARSAEALYLPAPPYLTAPEPPVCGSVDCELFFPDNYGQGNRAQIDEAKAACRACPLREQCLEWALSQDDDPWGVWGGTTPPERKKMRARRAA